MLSSEFGLIDPSKVWVDRAKRQRRVFTTDDLDESIRLRGVYNPIIITREFELKAGERRLTSAIKVGLKSIPFRFIDSLDPIEHQILELEENLRRLDLNWKDQVRAIANIHELYVGRDPEWTQARTADMLGLSPPTVAQYLRVSRDLDSPKLATASSLASAYNLLTRIDQRKITDAMLSIGEAGASILQAAVEKLNPQVSNLTIEPRPKSGPEAPEPLPEPAPAPESILNVSFLDWAPSYSGPRFNFIHCDFPYGINAFDGTQGAGAGASSAEVDLAGAKSLLYSDSPETYWELCSCLTTHLDRLMSSSAHLLFWFSMHYYEDTLKFFRQKAPSLIFNPIPLIWHKTDNRGVIADARRRPRHVYETALMAYRADRPIVKSVSDAYGAPTDKSIHHSAKVEPMLRYFFGMFVDETTRLLDPTCGGGSALRAAESLGAKSVLGLEIDPEHYENARRALRQARLLSKASKGA